MFSPPTIASLKAQIIADIEAEIGQSTPILSRAFTRVLAKALAGVLAVLYRYILWAYLQIFPQTADVEAIAYYEGRYGITPNPDIPAVLQILLTGIDGTTAPAGTYWTSPDNGLVYSQAASATISGGTASVQAQCLTAGAIGTLSPASLLTLVSPLAGITGAAVTSVVLAGQDADTLDERRSQILARMRRTDEIGTAGFYISSALEVAGIAFARVTRDGSGNILVYPLTALSGIARVPDSGLIATVLAYMTDISRRPLCANVYVMAATERIATITITGASPNDAATKANIEAAIASYLYAAYPRQYTDEADPTDVVSIGDLWAIVRANGAKCSAVSLTVSGIGSGISDYTLPIGEIIKAGTVTWA